MTKQAWISIGAAIGVGIAVVAIIAAASVPLPKLPPLAPNQVDGSLAFATDGNCIRVADLSDASVRELHCVPERDWISSLYWSEEGVEVTVEGNRSTVTVLDPVTGEVLDTRSNEFFEDHSIWEQDLYIDRNSDGEIIIVGSDNHIYLTLTGPERYNVHTVSGDPNGPAIAFIDSSGRLAVFDRTIGQAYLVDDHASEYPPPAWRP